MQGLEGGLVHVLGWIRHAQLGQDGRLHVVEHAGRLREVAGRGFEPFCVAAVRSHGELRVKCREIVQDVEELVLEVVGHERPLGVVAQGRVPCELGTDVDRELARHPDQLPRVGLELLDAAVVRLPDVDCIAAELLDDLEVVAEHIRVLVIFRRDVLSY